MIRRQGFYINKLPLFIIIVLIKTLMVRHYLFPEVNHFPVAILEAAFLTLIFGLIELFNKKEKLNGYITADFLLSTFYLSILMYYNHFGRILDYHVLIQAPLLSGMGQTLAELFSLKFLLLYIDFLGIGLIYLLSRRALVRQEREKQLSARMKSKSLAFIMAIAFVLCIFKVYFYQEKNDFMIFSQEAGLLNAQIYEILKVFDKQEEVPIPATALTRENIQKIKGLGDLLWPKYFGAAKNRNILIIQLESLEKFVIGLSIDGQEITPNLNKIAAESLYFTHFYSQVGQGNTSDAEFAVNTSIYPLEKGIISTQTEGLEFPSLPRLLKENGYKSVTFHPNRVTFFRRDFLYPALGYDKYYDKSYFGDEDKVGPWGSSDEVLYKKTMPVILQLINDKQKFYANIISLSNHHAYIIPEAKKHLELPAKYQGTLIGDYLTSVNYSDYALGKFVEELKRYNLWDNSLIIIYGDHFGISQKYTTANYQELLSPLLGREYDSLDFVSVPMFLKVPGIEPQIIGNVGGQIDILPTIANLLGISLEGQLVFGQDILNYDHNLLGFRYYNPEGTYINEEVFHTGGSNQWLDINTHKTTDKKESYQRDEERIKQLIQLSDNYLKTLTSKNIP